MNSLWALRSSESDGALLRDAIVIGGGSDRAGQGIDERCVGCKSIEECRVTRKVLSDCTNNRGGTFIIIEFGNLIRRKNTIIDAGICHRPCKKPVWPLTIGTKNQCAFILSAWVECSTRNNRSIDINYRISTGIRCYNHLIPSAKLKRIGWCFYMIITIYGIVTV